MGTTQKKTSTKSKPATDSSKATGTKAKKTPAVQSKTRKKPAETSVRSNQERFSMKPEKSVLRYEIELISIFGLTLLSAVAIHTEWTGFFGSLMKAIYLGLFGFAGVLLTYSIFLIVFFNINRYFSDRKWRLIGATICAFLSVWIFSTTFNYPNLYDILYSKGQILMSPEGMKESFDQGILLRGGGVLGNSLVFALINAVGKFGAYLLGTIFAAFAIVLAFKVSLTNMIKRSGISTFNGLKPLAGKVHMPKRVKRVNENNEQEEEKALSQPASASAVVDGQRVTLDDLPRAGKDIEYFNSDHYFEEIAKHVNLETGEYIDPVQEEVTLEGIEEIPEEIPPTVHYSAFEDSNEENDTADDEDTAESLQIIGLETELEAGIAPELTFDMDSEVSDLDTFVIPEYDTEQEDPESFESEMPLVSEETIEAEPILESVSSTSVELPKVVPAKTEPVAVAPAPIIPPKPKPKPYIMPPLTLLNPAKAKTSTNRDEIVENVKILEVTLKNFGVDAKVTEVTKGPAITMYEILPAPGVKVSKIVNLTDDIALALAASQIRIIAPIPGKSAIGIEIPNKDTTMVTAREVFESDDFKKTDSKLSVALGKEITGKTMIADLAKMPHLLIAGSTGSGKSVCVNTIINSILFNAKPDEVKLLMIDPKVVELSHYNGIPHLILPVVVDPKKASIALNWAVNEMTNRYKTFAEQTVKDINSYNRKAETMPELQLEKMAKIVIIVDELADLMMVAPNQVEDAICRLAQMARAAGIHLIVATQRPSVDVITGLIKANIPSRIAFAVSSQIDSRTILDMAGAEKLLGKGDMLFYPLGANKPIRIQGAFLADAEVEGVVDFIKKQTDEVAYQEEILADIPEVSNSMEADELLKDAIEMVIDTGQASISMVQRKFRVGYNRAARLVDQMEERGVVGPSLGSKPREVLMTRLELEQLKL